MVPGDVWHYGDTQSYCTGVAVILKMPYQGVYLALADAVSVGEDGHGVRHLVATADHIVEVDKKVDVIGILKADARFSNPGEQLTVKIQYLKYGHVGKKM